MKKLFVVALAALGMVACVNEDVVETPKSDVIAFAGASIDNATRAAEDPSFDQVKGNLDAFNVWAFMTTTNGPVFEGEEVTKNGNVWGYGDTQYWAPEKDYYFAALAPMNSDNWEVALAVSPEAELGLGTVTFTNVDGTEDLIYAKKALTTPTMSELLAEGMEPVKLNFQHLLSKVKFTFTNGFTTGNAGVVVKNITMKVPGAGEINLAQTDYANAWVLDGSDVTLEFGDVRELAAAQATPDKDECTYERLSIPATDAYSYEINFTVELYHGTELAYTVDKVSAVSGVAFEMGKAYNLTATITPENLELLPIEFAVEVDGWELPYEEVKHPVVATLNNVPYYSLQAAIDAAVAGDNTIYLQSKVKENVTLVQTPGVNVVIDGQNYEYDGYIRINGKSSTDTNKSLTIKNINFVNYSTNPSVDMHWGKTNETRYAHNVTVKDCTFTMLGAAKHVAVAIKCYQPYNITVDGVEVTGAHSVLQVTGGHDGVAVSNVVATDVKSGISFGTHDGPTSVENAQISALGYGIRMNGTTTTCNIKDVTIDAVRPVIARKVTSGLLTVNFSGNNTLTAGDYYQVIFTTGDDEAAYGTPAAANYALNGADDFKVYPLHKGDKVATAEEFTAKLASGAAEIMLEGGAQIDGVFYTSGNVTITSPADNKAVISGSLNSHAGTLTVKNVAFKTSAKSLEDPKRGSNASYSGNGYCKGTYAAIVSLYAQDAYFEGCEFKGLWVDNNACAINTYVCGDNSLVVKDCYFEGNTKAMYVRCNTTIEGCTFNMPNAVGAYVLGNGWDNDGWLTVINNNVDGLYSPIGFLNNYAFDDIHVNVQGNTGTTVYGFAWVNAFANARPTYNFTFAEGSKTF